MIVAQKLAARGRKDVVVDKACPDFLRPVSDKDSRHRHGSVRVFDGT